MDKNSENDEGVIITGEIIEIKDGIATLDVRLVLGDRQPAQSCPDGVISDRTLPGKLD